MRKPLTLDVDLAVERDTVGSARRTFAAGAGADADLAGAEALCAPRSGPART